MIDTDLIGMLTMCQAVSQMHDMSYIFNYYNYPAKLVLSFQLTKESGGGG